MFTDFVLNGRGQPEGELGEFMSHPKFDVGCMRPFVDRKGRKCVSVKTGRMIYNEEQKRDIPEQRTITIQDAFHHGYPVNIDPVANATLLRKDEYLMFDTVLIKAARQRLRAWSDLAASNTFSGFDGMGVQVLQWETQSDVGEAVVDMDAISVGRGDRPQHQLESLPLPITHVDFHFSQREIASGRRLGTPIDTTTAEQAGRRIAETIEQTLIGTVTGITADVTPTGGNASTVYGYTNHPDRVTKTDITVPDGTNAAVTLGEVLEMIETMANQRFYGPFMVYHSTDWDKFMDDDYVAAAPQNTLRERLRKIEAVTDVRRLDFLDSTFTLLLVQMTSDVARAVIGMDFTTVQWPTKGGLQQNFKVMTIQVPQLRSDFNGRSGIMHGTTT